MTTELDIQLTATGEAPLVGVVMGSDSDWPTMEPAVAALAEFGIACEVGVVSAHRMPEDMVAYGRSASARGLRVIIAGAGGAAHLPGMLAALTEWTPCTPSSRCPPACPSRPSPSRARATRVCSLPGSSARVRVSRPRPYARRCVLSRRTCAMWPVRRVRPSPNASVRHAERGEHKDCAGSPEGAARRILEP